MFPLRASSPARRTPWVTWLVMLACGLVFLYEAIQPTSIQRDIMQQFAMVPSQIAKVLAGRFDADVAATIVSSMFMHGGVVHIAGNMLFLHAFGDGVEDAMGSFAYGGFYLLCGIGAALTQVAVDPSSTVPVVGASGAIAGVLAAYLVLYPRGRVLTLVPIIFFYRLIELPAPLLIVGWFLLQFASGVFSLGVQQGGGVAYWAHIGGFAVGLALALGFRAFDRRRIRIARRNARSDAW